MPRPIALIIVAAIAAAFVVPDLADSRLLRHRWLWFLVLTAACLYVYFFCIRLADVQLLGDVLLVSDFSQQISVPLLEVDRASGTMLIHPELVWLHFSRPTNLGDKVAFRPPWRLFVGFSEHPVVRELNALIARAKGGAA